MNPALQYRSTELSTRSPPRGPCRFGMRTMKTMCWIRGRLRTYGRRPWGIALGVQYDGASACEHEYRPKGGGTPALGVGCDLDADVGRRRTHPDRRDLADL